MKKIIDKKTYDTMTAKVVRIYRYVYAGDFQPVFEVLHRKKTGEYFLYGSGGPASKYPQPKIIPLTLAEAEAFMIKSAKMAAVA